MFVVESEDDGSVSYSPILSADNSPNNNDVKREDNSNSSLVTVQEDHEFDGIENRPAGEIFAILC